MQVFRESLPQSPRIILTFKEFFGMGAPTHSFLHSSFMLVGAPNKTIIFLASYVRTRPPNES